VTRQPLRVNGPHDVRIHVGVGSEFSDRLSCWRDLSVRVESHSYAFGSLRYEYTAALHIVSLLATLSIVVGVQRVQVAGVPIQPRLHLRPHHSARLRASANEFFDECAADLAAGSGDWDDTQVSTGRGSRSTSTPIPGPVPPALLRSHPPRSIPQPSKLPSSPLARSSMSRAGAPYSHSAYNAR
jgi:hypothetical protein